jgi:hypothetical protein
MWLYGQLKYVIINYKWILFRTGITLKWWLHTSLETYCSILQCVWADCQINAQWMCHQITSCLVSTRSKVLQFLTHYMQAMHWENRHTEKYTQCSWWLKWHWQHNTCTYLEANLTMCLLTTSLTAMMHWTVYCCWRRTRKHCLPVTETKYYVTAHKGNEGHIKQTFNRPPITSNIQKSHDYPTFSYPAFHVEMLHIINSQFSM